MTRFTCVPLIGLTVLLAPAISRAELAVAQTPEWLGHSANLIVRATPIEVGVTKGPGTVRFTRARYRVDEVLKGPLTAGDSVTIYDYAMKPDPLDLTAAVKAARPMLVFAEVAEDRHEEINGRYVVMLQHRPGSAFFLDGPVAGLYTGDGQRLTRWDDVLDRVRAQVAQERQFRRVHRQGRVAEERRDAATGSDAFRDLYSGSDVIVRVPAYHDGR